MEHERKAIESSLIAYAETAVEPDVSAARASTIVDAAGPRDAFAIAIPRLDEALDVLASANPMPAFSSYQLMEAGCARDLMTGCIVPRVPSSNPQDVNMRGSIFLMNQYEWEPRDLAQHVLSTERGELGERFARAAHWTRKADLESNPHLAMIFEWFAAESIWNVRRDDDVVPSIRWSLGFPNGQGARILAATTRDVLNADTLHRAWSGHIDDRLRRIRAIRNQTVHNGFRQIDVASEELRGLPSVIG